MELNYKISKKIYLKFIKDNLKYMKLYELPVERFRLYALLLMFLACRLQPNNREINIGIYVIAFLFVITWRSMVRIRYSGSFKSDLKRKDYLLKDITINVSENNLMVSRGSEESIFLWNAISNINIINGFIIISTEFMDKIIIPKTVFNDKNEYEKFIDIFSQYTGLNIENDKFDILFDMIIENFIYYKDK